MSHNSGTSPPIHGSRHFFHLHILFSLRLNQTRLLKIRRISYNVHRRRLHHHISVMELGHLLTRSGLTYPEVSPKVCHDSFCQLGNSDLLQVL